MELKSVELGALLDIDIFNQIFAELYNKKVIPNNFSQSTPVNATVQLDKPSFQLRRVGQRPPYTALHITGTIQVNITGRSQTDTLDAWVLLTLTLLPRANDVPILVMQYDGLNGTPDPSYIAPYIDDYFQKNVIPLINSIRIPIFDKMVEKLEDTYYPRRGRTIPPNRDIWPTSCLLLLGDSENVDSLGCFIARPENSSDPQITQSFLPKVTGFGIVYSKGFLDFTLDKAAKANIGTTQNDAKIVQLSMNMVADAILVNGQAKKDVLGGLDTANIFYSGPVRVYLKRGTYKMVADAKAVSVNVDKSWLATMLFFINAVGSMFSFTFTQILDLIIMLKIEIEVREAPGKVQQSLGDGLSEGLEALVEGLPPSYTTRGIIVAFTPDSSVTEDGNISVFAQVFVTPFKSTIQKAVYGREKEGNRWYRRFVEFTLRDGRKFKASELARLMKLKVITVDGYTQIKGKYVRSNPNKKLTDNLLERFGPKPRRRR